MSRGLGVAQASRDSSPEATWAALVPTMAARGRMRVSRDGGRSYRGRDERVVTDTLPNQPAAILVYDRTGCAPVIHLDLDVSRGGEAAVDRDHAAITRLLDRAGARWFSDRSPGGGRHIYVPLAEPAPFHEARAFTLAIAARTPSLDPLPMLNIHAGCIRPPGARHRTGGHQVLDQSVNAAASALARGTTRQVWRRLLDEVGTNPDSPATVPISTGTLPAQEEVVEALPGHGSPDASFTRIARTGEWPSEKYRTASEARQGVVWAAVASGWTLGDVARRLSDGTWPGLASLYARYSARHRHTALVRDWRRAIAFEKARRTRRSQERGKSPVRLRTTSPHKTHAPGILQGREVNREVRVWLAAVDILTKNGDPATKAVLYALGEAAAVTGSVVVEHGNRSLSIATGLDQSSVGRILKALREAPADRLLVDLVREAEGVRANSYALVIPPLLRPACESKPWRRGKIHAVRPVFRELGLVAAFVYDAVEQAREPLSGRVLAQVAGVGHTAAYDALASLAAWGLVSRAPGGGWMLGHSSPAQVAEQIGVEDQVVAQIAKYRAERLAWWRYLGLVDEPPVPEDAEVTRLDDWRHSPPPSTEPPPGAPPDTRLGSSTGSTDARTSPARPGDDPSAAIALLARVLGARVV